MKFKSILFVLSFITLQAFGASETDSNTAPPAAAHSSGRTVRTVELLEPDLVPGTIPPEHHGLRNRQAPRTEPAPHPRPSLTARSISEPPSQDQSSALRYMYNGYFGSRARDCRLILYVITACIVMPMCVYHSARYGCSIDSVTKDYCPFSSSVDSSTALQQGIPVHIINALVFISLAMDGLCPRR